MALVGLLIALFLVALVLCAAETSLVRISEVRAVSLASTRGRRGRRLAELIDDLPAVLSAVLFGELVAQIGAATVVGVLASRWLGDAYVAVASAILAIVLFVYTEAIPKTLAVRQPERVALLVTYPVAVLAAVLRPVVRILVWFADLQMPGRMRLPASTVTEEELRWLVGRAEREREISATDRRLIERSLAFGDRTVQEIMVSRPDIVAVDASMHAGEALDAALRSGHRLIVVYDEDLDHGIGTTSAADLARSAEAAPEPRVRDLMGELLVVPESRRLPGVLADMQKHETEIALVIDEFGSTAGVVTIEDLAEELVGSMTDFGRGTSSVVRRIGPSRWLVRGGTALHEVEEITGQNLPSEDWTTIAGLVIGHIGRMPRAGDEVFVGAVRLRVLVVRRRRVRLIEVSLLDPVEGASCVPERQR